MAAALLRALGNKVNVKETTLESGKVRRDYFLPCLECQPGCMYDHQSAVEKYKELGGAVSVLEFNTLSRFIKDIVNNFVTKILSKHVKDYDLHLLFERSGNVSLIGSLWLNEMDAHNHTNRCLTDQSVIPDLFKDLEFFGDLFGVGGGCEVKMINAIQELDLNPDLDTIQEQTSDRLDVVREGHLLEAIYVQARGLQNQWSSQKTIKLDLKDLD